MTGWFTNFRHELGSLGHTHLWELHPPIMKSGLARMRPCGWQMTLCVFTNATMGWDYPVHTMPRMAMSQSTPNMWCYYHSSRIGAKRNSQKRLCVTFYRDLLGFLDFAQNVVKGYPLGTPKSTGDPLVVGNFPRLSLPSLGHGPK